MSTRVQKGNTTFKPVAKPRARSAVAGRESSRQPSVVRDYRASATPAVVPDISVSEHYASGNMAPPSIAPTRSVPADVSAEFMNVFPASGDSSVSSRSYPPVVSSATSSSAAALIGIENPGTGSSDGPPAVPLTSGSDSSMLLGVSRSTPIVVCLRNDHGIPSISIPSLADLPAVNCQELDNIIAGVASDNTAAPLPPGQIETNSETHILTISSAPTELRMSVVTDVSVKEKENRRTLRKRSVTSGDGRAAMTSESESEQTQRKRTRVSRSRSRPSEVAVNEGNPSNEGAAGASNAERAGEQRASSRKPRRSRAPSLPLMDATADPGEELDPTVVTMATLCNDTGQGRTSSKVALIRQNHAAWKLANKEKRARLKSLSEAKKYGREEDEENTRRAEVSEQVLKSKDPSPAALAGTSPHISPRQIQALDDADEESITQIQDASGSGFDYSQPLATSRYNVQVRIGPNGETVVDEESLFVDRTAEDESQNYTHVEESDLTKFVNSASYGKKFRGTRWSAEETELFYNALSQFGENYELISYVLPGRDRKACKNKFKIEDKKNPGRITYCLNNRRPYDIQTLSRMTGRDFSGPTPEIRVPQPVTLAENPPDKNPAPDTMISVEQDSEKQSFSSGEDHEEEILGETVSFDDQG